MKRSELKQLIREAIEEVKSDKFTIGTDKSNTLHPSFFVYNTETGEKSKVFKTKKEAEEYLKKKNSSVNEDVINEGFAPEVDEIGAFWVVEKPTLNSTINDVCFECKDVAYFANQVRGGLNPEDIKGIFTKEAKAKKLAEKLLADRDKKKDEAKKAGEAYKKMKDEALAKVQEYMKHKGKAKEVVDELTDVTKS